MTIENLIDEAKQRIAKLEQQLQLEQYHLQRLEEQGRSTFTKNQTTANKKGYFKYIGPHGETLKDEVIQAFKECKMALSPKELVETVWNRGNFSKYPKKNIKMRVESFLYQDKNEIFQKIGSGRYLLKNI